jgi:two-component system, chemotaxis family, response regulator Rcp1
MAAMDLLLIEDNPGDLVLVHEAFRASNRLVRLRVARDGVEALDSLCRDSPLPDLILMDLNLPKMHGRDLLKRLKTDEAWKLIPTVVLSTSDAEDDVRYCYGQHATCYIKKPDQWAAFTKVVKFATDYWHLAAKSKNNVSECFPQITSADRFYFQSNEQLE